LTKIGWKAECLEEESAAKRRLLRDAMGSSENPPVVVVEGKWRGGARKKKAVSERGKRGEWIRNQYQELLALLKSSL